MRNWTLSLETLVYVGAHTAFNAFCLMMWFGWLPVPESPVWLVLGTAGTIGLAYVDYRCLVMSFTSRSDSKSRLWLEIPLKLYLILHAILVTVLVLTGGVAVITLLLAGYFSV